MNKSQAPALSKLLQLSPVSDAPRLPGSLLVRTYMVVRLQYPQNDAPSGSCVQSNQHYDIPTWINDGAGARHDPKQLLLLNGCQHGVYRAYQLLESARLVTHSDGTKGGRARHGQEVVQHHEDEAEV